MRARRRRVSRDEMTAALVMSGLGADTGPQAPALSDAERIERVRRTTVPFKRQTPIVVDHCEEPQP